MQYPHPHVFGDRQGRTRDESDVKKTWEAEKARERAKKDHHGVLDGVPKLLPALKRAQKLQKRAANVGFDWQSSLGVIKKVYEEISELEEAIKSQNANEIKNEMGDLFFSCVNLARHLKIDAEMSLIASSDKFEHRFKNLEIELKESGRKPEDCSLAELDRIWTKVKYYEAN